MSKIVERTLDLLELFAEEKRPLSLSDIAHLLKIPVSSCHDVLRAMQSRGYIYEIAPRAGYYPTLRLQALGKIISDHDPVVTRAELLLRSLRESLDESVMLSKVSGLQAVYVLVLEASRPLRFTAKVGDRVSSLHATSGGRALLGSLSDEDLTDFLNTARLTAFTKQTITAKAALRREIQRGKKRNWFLNRGESQDGVTTISAPFHWNNALYIVTIAGPSARLEPRLETAVDLMTGVCRVLEMRHEVPAPSRRDG